MVWQPVVRLLRLVRMWWRWVSAKEVGEAFRSLLVDAQPSCCTMWMLLVVVVEGQPERPNRCWRYQAAVYRIRPVCLEMILMITVPPEIFLLIKIAITRLLIMMASQRAPAFCSLPLRSCCYQAQPSPPPLKTVTKITQSGLRPKKLN